MFYIFIVLASLYTLHWVCGVIYLIHPFKCLVWMYHDIMGWHKPDSTSFHDGCSNHSRCRFCSKDIMQDSQGNWFTFGPKSKRMSKRDSERMLYSMIVAEMYNRTGIAPSPNGGIVARNPETDKAEEFGGYCCEKP